jgi:hypothetical protein
MNKKGIAKRRICTAVGMARTMMLYAALQSGDRVIIQDLCPQAMGHAVWLYNSMPQMDKIRCSPSPKAYTIS